MYAEHQPIISKYAARGPRELANVARFVLATIRTSFPDAISSYKTLVTSGERRPIAYFGDKHRGLDYLDNHSVSWWNAIHAARRDRDTLVATFATVPGIGLVKAGFLAQLGFGVSGCIDTHNLQRFGMDYGDVRFNKGAKWSTWVARAHHYNSVTDALGGPELLWNEWCEYVSRFQGYGTPEEVSAMHLQVIV